jgi:DNA-binding SARP family transcriptional activator
MDQIMDETWGENIPRRPAATLHVYISQLRKFLRRRGRRESPIITRQHGYMLHLGSDEFDLRDYERLVKEGKRHAEEHRYEAAAEVFDEALSLWRGPALGDLRCGVIVSGFATWLEEARLECLEMMIDAQLSAGRHREIIGLLQVLTMEYPLRESFYRRLMIALYRSECQAEALKVYHQARESINGELGVEPCRALRELQRAILAEDDQLKYRSHLDIVGIPERR